jgi:putative nucleotidyltransferase with HDIG domain
VQRVLRLESTREPYYDEINGLLQQDPVFIERLLALANAALEGPARPLGSLRLGLPRMGARRIGLLVTALGVADAFAPTTEAQQRTWEHSVAVAAGARFLVHRIASGEVDPEEAYLAGLLHDVGQFVLYRSAPDEPDWIEKGARNEGAGLIQAERERFGTDHAAVGGHACEAWGFPPEMSSVVRHHHVGLQSLQTLTPAVRETVAAVQMADVLSLMLAGSAAFRVADEARRRDLLRRARGRFARAGRWCTPEVLAATTCAMEEETPRGMRGLLHATQA